MVDVNTSYSDKLSLDFVWSVVVAVKSHVVDPIKASPPLAKSGKMIPVLIFCRESDGLHGIFMRISNVTSVFLTQIAYYST